MEEGARDGGPWRTRAEALICEAEAEFSVQKMIWQSLSRRPNTAQPAPPTAQPEELWAPSGISEAGTGSEACSEVQSTRAPPP